MREAGVIDVILASTDGNAPAFVTMVTVAITTMDLHVSTADGNAHVAAVSASTITDMSVSIAIITS